MYLFLLIIFDYPFHNVCLLFPFLFRHGMPAVPRQAIRKESCWTISNITAGNREQIQEAMKSTMNMASFSTEPFLTINDLMMCIFFIFFWVF